MPLGAWSGVVLQLASGTPGNRWKFAKRHKRELTTHKQEKEFIHPFIYLFLLVEVSEQAGGLMLRVCVQERCGVLRSAHLGWLGAPTLVGGEAEDPLTCELLCKVHTPQTPVPLRLSIPELFMESCSECSLCSPLSPNLAPNCCQEPFLLLTPCSLLLRWLQEGVPSAVVFSRPFSKQPCSTCVDEGKGCHPCEVWPSVP